MTMAKIRTEKSVDEDLKELGIGGLSEAIGGADDLAVAQRGALLTEGKKKDVCSDCGEDPCVCDADEPEDEEEYDESRHDPLDGPFVTNELFDRIEALPYDTLSEEQVDEVIEQLKGKKIPKNIEGITERAEKVARSLLERYQIAVVKGKRTRRKIDTSGKHRAEKRERRMKERPKRSRIKRQAKITGRKNPAKMAAKKTARTKERLGLNNSQEFAAELESLLGESVAADTKVRVEVLERVERIVDLLEDEFDDEQVSAVFESAMDPIVSSYHGGRLDEDVMDEAAFLAEIKPVLTLISKSLDRIERGN